MGLDLRNFAWLNEPFSKYLKGLGVRNTRALTSCTEGQKLRTKSVESNEPHIHWIAYLLSWLWTIRRRETYGCQRLLICSDFYGVVRTDRVVKTLFFLPFVWNLQYRHYKPQSPKKDSARSIESMRTSSKYLDRRSSSREDGTPTIYGIGASTNSIKFFGKIGINTC